MSCIVLSQFVMVLVYNVMQKLQKISSRVPYKKFSSYDRGAVTLLCNGVDCFSIYFCEKKKKDHVSMMISIIFCSFFEGMCV